MLVSVVIPALEWDQHLEHTLATVADQALPDGVTLETTVALAGRPPADLPARTRVIPNPGRSIPEALNRAVAASTGEVIVRVDARCDLPADHVARIVATLADERIGCVGGAQLVLDRGRFGSAYAVAFNSALLGPSAYRYRRTSGPIDSAYLGAWRRDDLERLGGFDVRLLRNQDNELADRVRRAGFTVWYDADLVVGYWNSRGLRATMAHHREFGAWRRLQRGHGQRALTPRHVGALAALATAGFGTVATLGSARGRRVIAGVGLVAYGAAGIAAHASAARLRGARPDLEGPALDPVGVALAPAAATAINASWLVGLVTGRGRSTIVARDAGQAVQPEPSMASKTATQESSTRGHDDASAS